MSDSEHNLTDEEKARVQKAKSRAVMRRQSRLTTYPYYERKVVSLEERTVQMSVAGTTRFKDTGGGFLLEEKSAQLEIPSRIVVQQPPIIEPDRPTCTTCNKIFAKSWLFDTFDLKVCDNCKDSEVHKLITKSKAMDLYMLKEVDFEKRKPALKYITKTNPHNNGWSKLKLYSELQVEQRSLEVWGSKKEMEAEMERREEKRILNKTKRYNRKMKELRMNVRSSLYDRTSTASHVHEFDEEIFNVGEDNYTHKCKTCSYVETFEKM